jgi:hypothetical protein
VKYPDKTGDEYEVKYITDDLVRLEIGRDSKLKTIEVDGKTIENPDYDERGDNGWMTRILCLAVVNWKGITSGGKDLPCTDENKKKLFVKFTLSRGNFIFERCRNEKLFLGTELEKELKN